MTKQPPQLVSSGRSGLAVVEPKAAGAAPHPSIESIPDFSERVGAWFRFVEELRESGAPTQELATAEATLGEMMRDLRQRAPRGLPSFQEIPLSLEAAADIIREQQQRLGAGAAPHLSERLRRLALPLQIELLRPQRTFNLQLLAMLRQLPTRRASARPGEVPAWIRQELESLASPSSWKLRSHRAGLPARTVMLAKKSGLELLRHLLQPALERMRSWNLAAIELLCTTHRDSPLPTRAQVEPLVARLEELADPCPPHLGLPARLSNVFALQRDFVRRLNPLLARQFALSPVVGDVAYRQWCAEREPARLDAATRQALLLPQPPGISVVVGARPVKAAHWRECIASVLGQSYDSWELCIAGPESELAELRGHLPPEWAGDSRLRFLSSPGGSGLTGALNTALSAMRGEAVAFLDPADKLAPQALAEVALALRAHPESRLFYSDEDQLDGNGYRHRPFFKPDWSRDMQRESNYASRLLVARRTLCEELGGVRAGSEGAELMDFVLRASEQPYPISHLPSILYHRRELPQSFQVLSASSHSALAQHLSRCQEDAEVWRTRGGMLRVRHRIQGTPRVSVIVPVQDEPEPLARLLRSFRAKTRWENWQLILVSHGPVGPRTEALLAELDEPRILKLTSNPPFNLSALYNLAARHAEGELLLFLDNAVELVDETWMEELIAQAQRPDVGLVGPLLLRPDGLVQHAGFVLGIGGFAASPFWRYHPAQEWTPFGRLDHVRDYLAVSGACMMVRREVFEAVKGYDERFRAAGGDVDLALRIGKQKLRCVYTPHTRVVHHTWAVPRLGLLANGDAWLTCSSLRPWLSGGDPFYNPHLTLNAMGCDLRTDARSGQVLALQRLVWEHPQYQGAPEQGPGSLPLGEEGNRLLEGATKRVL